MGHHDRNVAHVAGARVRAALRGVISENPDHPAEALAGALAEVLNRHVAAYGPKRTAAIAERAARIVRSAPREMKEA